MGTERNSFLRDSSYSLIAKISMALARGFGILAISRALGPEQYGQYAIVLNTYVVMVMVGGLGLEQANTYFVGRTPQACRALLINAGATSLVLGLATVLLFLGLVRLCAGWLFEASAIGLMRESMLFVPVAILHQQLSGLVVGLSRFRYLALAEAGKWGAYLGVILVLSATGTLDERSALHVFYLAIGLTGCLHVVVIHGEARRLGVVDLARRDLAWRTLHYGLRAFMVNVVNLLNFRFDLYLVKYFRSLSEVGNYSLGMNLAEIVLYFGRSINVVLFSRVSSNQERTRTLTPVIARHTLLFVLGMTTCILLVKDTLIATFLGDGYATCANIVTLTLPGIAAQSLTLVLMADLLGRGQLRHVFASALLSFVVMVGLDLAWIAPHGIHAAAVASTLAYVAQSALLLRYHSATTHEGVGRYLLVTRRELSELVGRIRRLVPA